MCEDCRVLKYPKAKKHLTEEESRSCNELFCSTVQKAILFLRILLDKIMQNARAVMVVLVDYLVMYGHQKSTA